MPWNPRTQGELKAVANFEATFADREIDRIDPEHVLDWSSLALGYFLGQGLGVDEAKAAARYVGHNLVFLSESGGGL